MNKLLYKEAFRKRDSRRSATLNDLRDFPTNGIHRDIMKKAVFLNKNQELDVSEEQAVDLIKAKFESSVQRRGLQYREVENAVRTAFNSCYTVSCPQRVVNVHHTTKTSENSYWNDNLEKLTCSSLSLGELKTCADEFAWAVEDMWEDSPLRVDECSPVEILSMMYKDDDLLCTGTLTSPKTQKLEHWVKNDLCGDLFCPNPMRLKVGVNKEGKESQRCRDNVGQRYSIVYECDEVDLSFDQKAALVKCVWEKSEANLRMVVHSGCKSLHAHFEASEDEEVNWHFMNMVVKYGGDPQMYCPEQTSRLPNAVRLKPFSRNPLLDDQGMPIRQKCLYFNF
jgi:hypothetical protein